MTPLENAAMDYGRAQTHYDAGLDEGIQYYGPEWVKREKALVDARRRLLEAALAVFQAADAHEGTPRGE